MGSIFGSQRGILLLHMTSDSESSLKQEVITPKSALHVDLQRRFPESRTSKRSNSPHPDVQLWIMEESVCFVWGN